MARARPTRQLGTGTYVTGAVVAVFSIAVCLALITAAGASRVGDEARSLHWVDSTSLVSTHLHAGLPQALTLSELEQRGRISEAEGGLDSLPEARWELEDLFTAGQEHDSYPALARFLEPVSAAVEALEEGDLVSARDALGDRFENAYLELGESLEAERTVIEASFEAHTTGGIGLTDWLVFVLVVAIPASAAAYLLFARRQTPRVDEHQRAGLESGRAASRSKDGYLERLSHQLRTPLTSIYGFSRILAEGGVTGAEGVEETGGIIATEAAEMTRMVDDLGVAMRLETTGIEVERVTTNVGQVVEAAVAPFRSAGLDVSWEPVTAFALTDGNLLQHVLVNLLSNAARHGGPSVGLDVTEGDGTVDVEVWDDGPGVPDDQADLLVRCFDGFEAGLFHPELGVGLTVAARLTALMSGALAYQRFAGKTFFVVTLPVAAPNDADGSDGAESVAAMIRALSA